MTAEEQAIQKAIMLDQKEEERMKLMAIILVVFTVGGTSLFFIGYFLFMIATLAFSFLVPVL